MIFGGIFVDFGVHFCRPFGTLWAHFGALVAQICALLVPLRATFRLFRTLGVSFCLVLGEIHLLRQKLAKKKSCIDPDIKFLANFRMQIIFPRPGGGTIAAGLEKVAKMVSASYAFWEPCWYHFHEKSMNKSMRTSIPKKT